MGKIVIVAEKPSVARDIARVMSAPRRGDGFLEGDKYIVTWALGHLVALCDPDEVNPKYKRWDFRDLPIIPDEIPLKILPRSASQYEIIRRLITDPGTDSLICATDSGREGELIFRLIYQMSGCTKPFQRLWISSMTDEAIREGFANLQPSAAYDALFHSAKCRSEADWIVGMNGSRAYTLRYHARLSVGRVQTPTLAILVRRAREIAAFDTREYREVVATFDLPDADGASNAAYAGTWFDPQTQETRIFDEDRAKTITREISRQRATVLEVDKQLKRVPPAQLYDLTTLQRDANRMLGFSAAKTLELMQSLYERHKVLTYPRTDSRYLPMDMAPRVQKALQSLKGTPYGSLVTPILAQPELPTGKRFFDDSKVSDHHAIVPTGNRPVNLSADENAVYDLVVRRLIASYYGDYTYNSTRVVTGVNDHRFISRGAVPAAAGWREVYASLRIDDEDEKQNAKSEGEGVVLPPLKVGDVRKVASAESRKKKTRPPSQHTEATLLNAMENAGKELEDETLRESMKDSGLGTPATRAAIIERLLSVGYIERKGKALLPTVKGEQLIDVVAGEMASPEITGKWEKGLSRIAKADMDPGKFMESIRKFTYHLIDEVRVARRDIQFEREERTGDAAKGAASKAADAGKGPGAGSAAGTGKPVGPGASADAPKAAKPTRAKAAKAVAGDDRQHCPLCGAVLIETDRAFGCGDWRQGCPFRVYKDALSNRGGPVIDAAMMKTLLGRGKSKRGENLVILENGRVRMERVVAK